MTRQQAGRCEVLLPAGARDSRFPQTPTPDLKLTQPPTKSVPVGLFPSGKAAGAWSWPLTEVKNECTWTSTRPACFQTGTTGSTSPFYLLPFNNHCPIQLIQPHYQLTEVRKLRGDRWTFITRSWRYSAAFLIKRWKRGALPHKTVLV